MPGKIYLVSLNGVPKYVGFTTRTIEKRWKQHIWESKKSHTRSCPVLQKAINKYGPEAFTITEIYSSEDVNHTLNVMEPQFIREHKTHVDDGGYNISYGGEASTRGRKHLPESINKMRKKHLGKIISDETKQKIRLANLGKSFSEETRQKLRMAHLGKTLSQETREKLSKAGKGRVVSQETREKLRQAAIKQWNK